MIFMEVVGPEGLEPATRGLQVHTPACTVLVPVNVNRPTAQIVKSVRDSLFIGFLRNYIELFGFFLRFMHPHDSNPACHGDAAIV
jgi:hypothetical protein